MDFPGRRQRLVGRRLRSQQPPAATSSAARCPTMESYAEAGSGCSAGSLLIRTRWMSSAVMTWPLVDGLPGGEDLLRVGGRGPGPHSRAKRRDRWRPHRQRRGWPATELGRRDERLAVARLRTGIGAPVCSRGCGRHGGPRSQVRPLVHEHLRFADRDLSRADEAVEPDGPGLASAGPGDDPVGRRRDGVAPVRLSPLVVV